jgi:molybdopterin adenylyltransferase
MSWQEHTSEELSKLKCSVTIVSDSLFQGIETNPEIQSKDESGPIALELLAEIGIGQTNIDYLPDEFGAIKAKVEEEALRKTDIIIFLGGTGISKRDVTVEALLSIIEKQIYGYGEEFRRQSIEKIGGFGMMSRAIAGTFKQSLVVALPGSPNATEMGLKLLEPIIGHTKQQLIK